MRSVRSAIAVVIALVVATACTPEDTEKSTSTKGGANPGRSAASPSVRHFAVTGERIVLLDKLSIPQMEEWYPMGVQDGDSSADFLFDLEGCNEGDEVVPSCSKLVAKPLERDISEAKSAAFELACSISTSGKVKPIKPEGTDKIGGVTATRYHRMLKDCKNIDFSSSDSLDPDSEVTLWYVKTDTAYMQIGAYDGPKDAPKFDIDKVRFALSHAEWVG